MRVVNLLKKVLDSRRKDVYFVAAFFVLTVLFTLPLLLNFGSFIAGEHGDAIQVLARIKQTENQLRVVFHAGVDGIIGYSKSVSGILSFLSLDFWMALGSIIFGPIISYNIFWVASFFLSSVFMYFFIREFTANRYAAFFAGALYTFAPYHFAYGNGFVGATHVELIPIFLLVFIRLLKKFSYVNVCVSILFFGIIAGTENHYAYFLALFCLPLVVYYLIGRIKTIKWYEALQYIIVFFILGILGFFAFKNFIDISLSTDNFLSVDILQQESRSLDIVSPVLPSTLHLFWGKFIESGIWKDVQNVVNSSPKHFAETTGYVTFVGLFFFVIGFVKRKKFKIKQEIVFWFVLTILFFIFSLGPYVSFMGPIFPRIPLPGLLMYTYLPFFNNIRAVGRFFPFMFVAFLVVSSFGFSYYFKIFRKKSKTFFLAAIFFIIIIELAISFNLVNVSIPSFITQLQKDPNQYSIVNLASATCYVCASQYELYNNFHSKTVLGGMSFARPSGGYSVEKTTPFLSELLYDLPENKEISRRVINHSYTNLAQEIINQENIRYIVLDKRWLVSDQNNLFVRDAFISPQAFMKIKPFISDNLDATFNEDEDFYIFNVKKHPSNNFVYVRLPRAAERNTMFDQENGREIHQLKTGDGYEFVNKSGMDMRVIITFSDVKETLPVSLSIGSQTQSIHISPEKRVVSIMIPSEMKSGMITMQFDPEKTVRIESIEYESISALRYHAEYKEILGEQSAYHVYDPETYVSFVPGDTFVNDLPVARSLDTAGLRTTILQSGVFNAHNASFDRDIFSVDYYNYRQYQLLKEKGVSDIIVDKKNARIQSQFIDYLLRTGLFSIKNETLHFIRMSLVSDNEIPHVSIIEPGSGFGDFVLDEFLTGTTGLFASRQVVDSEAEIRIDTFTPDSLVRFKMSDPSNSRTLRVQYGSEEKIFTLGAETQIEIPLVDEKNLQLEILDSHNKPAMLNDENPLYIYDVEVARDRSY